MSDSQWRFAERYDLLGRLGDGAVGSVWLVRDQRSGAEYAIKILLPELTARPEVAERLRAHLDAVRALGHPNIVAVDEVVGHEGRAALVMRPVAGDDLRVVLGRTGTLAAAHATILAAQLCDALAAAHAADIAHGAVKPSNVLLESRPGGEGSIRVGLTDFGMAALAAAADVTPLKDEIGERYFAALPVEYQAPEIAVGMIASPAADVYAVGALLYEVLSGAAPFTGEFADVQRRHREAQPQRIPGLPDPLWLLIASCLAKPPQHRPSALDLASLLRNITPTVADAPAWAMRDAQDTTLLSAATLSSRIARDTPPVPQGPDAPPASAVALTAAETMMLVAVPH
ncbi:MAG: serine/threonine-protein kinase, partial [Actinocrinis sp.]